MARNARVCVVQQPFVARNSVFGTFLDERLHIDKLHPILCSDVSNGLVHGLQDPQWADVLLFGQNEPPLCLVEAPYARIALAKQVEKLGVPAVDCGRLLEQCDLALGIGPIQLPSLAWQFGHSLHLVLGKVSPELGLEGRTVL